MANVLDLRRRIRSVKNTRQITRAMKMVSAAKLRRAQERALQARPYAQMLTNVLESLVRRTDLLDEASGDVMHPLLVEREEESVLVVVIAGDKGFAGGFNSNVGKAAQRFLDERRAQGQSIDLEPVGKKAIGLYKRPLSRPRCTSTPRRCTTTISRNTSRTTAAGPRRSRSPKSTRICSCGQRSRTSPRWQTRSSPAYERAEIDAVYVVYNEFKSVLSQRLVVEKLLPIRKLGTQEITVAEEMTQEQRDAAVKAAESAGVSGPCARE